MRVGWGVGRRENPCDTLEIGTGREGGRHSRWSAPDGKEGQDLSRGRGEDPQLAYLLPWQGWPVGSRGMPGGAGK